MTKMDFKDALLLSIIAKTDQKIIFIKSLS